MNSLVFLKPFQTSESSNLSGIVETVLLVLSWRVFEVKNIEASSIEDFSCSFMGKCLLDVAATCDWFYHLPSFVNSSRSFISHSDLGSACMPLTVAV